ncbi:MAG: response regulator [Phycisphaerae bacterium]|nr:response regulator [Phycisphaerae bacterium]
MAGPAKRMSEAPPITNTIRAGSAELHRLFAELDAGDSQGAHKRETHRWPFPSQGIRIAMNQPGGSESSLYYACRNLSSGGLGVLHSAYVHPGTTCTVYLPMPNRGEHPIEGTVVRCRHVRGAVHEVGIRFKESIKVREALTLDLVDGAFTLERVPPEKLIGCVLHVDDSSIDRRLLRHFLRETSLSVVSVEDGPSALARANEPFDLVLLDQDMPGMTGTETAEKLLAGGLGCPIMLVAGSVTVDVRRKAREARISAVLPKPLTEHGLLRAIAEFLVLKPQDAAAGAVVRSTLKLDGTTTELVNEFVEELHKRAEALKKALEASNGAEVYRQCSQISDAAPTLGFESIAEVAHESMLSMDGGKALTRATKTVRNLILLCLRARAVDSKAAPVKEAASG